MKTALVTGASSGIGAATAEALVGKGYRVLGTSRNPATATPIKGVRFVALDLNSSESIATCAASVGHVDVLVNNAGESQFGALEETPPDAVQRLFQTNVFGPVQLTQLLVPSMRAAGSGRVVMVGSMLGSFPLAFRSSYSASKAAIRTFATAARHELSPYDVWLTTVEPGSIATGLSERRTIYQADDSPYAKDHATVLGALNSNERTGISPETVAAKILEAIEADPPAQLYAVGSNAPVVFALRRIAPRGVVEKMISRKHGLKR